MSNNQCPVMFCFVGVHEGDWHSDYTGHSWWQPEGYGYVPGEHGMYGRYLPVWDFHLNDAGELCAYWQHEAPEGMERCPAGCADEDAVNPDPERLAIKQERWRRKAARQACHH